MNKVIHIVVSVLVRPPSKIFSYHMFKYFGMVIHKWLVALPVRII